MGKKKWLLSDERGPLCKLFLVPPTREYNEEPYIFVSRKFYDSWMILFRDLTFSEVRWLVAEIMVVGKVMKIETFNKLKVSRIADTDAVVEAKKNTYLTPLPYAERIVPIKATIKRSSTPVIGMANSSAIILYPVHG